MLWGLGLPFISFMILYRMNAAKELEKTENMEVYGFLYLGYLREKYLWELIILARKVLILANLIWMD